MSIRIRLDFAYDGSNFHGYAKQNDLRTVQGQLEEALKIFMRKDIELTVAGRTDAGVHACSQVVHFDTEPVTLLKSLGALEVFKEPENILKPEYESSVNKLMSDLVKKLNTVLAMLDKARVLHANENKVKSDIVVFDAQVVPEYFDARFSALSRSYRYVISDACDNRQVCRRNYVAWYDTPLNTDLMQEAAQLMLGESDFLSYCKPREGATTVRTLQRLEVQRNAYGEIEILVKADAFCHSMVRSIVGVLVAIGQGAKPVPWGKFLLDNPSRSHGVNIAPAHGLSLIKVEYPSQDQYAQQAEKAKHKRKIGENLNLPEKDNMCCD